MAGKADPSINCVTITVEIETEVGVSKKKVTVEAEELVDTFAYKHGSARKECNVYVPSGHRQIGGSNGEGSRTLAFHGVKDGDTLKIVVSCMVRDDKTFVPRETDAEYMRQAVKCALQCVPVETAYNVGAVIVDAAGRVLSTGFSREIEGNTHAEQCALLKLGEAKLPDNCTMYTTMEPCSKRLSGNEPCTSRILKTNIKRVVVGALEPKTFVENCEGVQLLRNAGVKVDILQGLEEECLAPNQHVMKA